MNQQKSLPKKLKNKNLLWYSGILIILLGLFGIGYGIFICYNGFLVNTTSDNAILELLNENTLTARDGMNALITFGTIIIIFYLLVTGLGFIGIISSSHLITRQTLFWMCLILLSIAIIFGFLGIFSINFALVNIFSLSLFGIALVLKYNKDINKLHKKHKK